MGNHDSYSDSVGKEQRMRCCRRSGNPPGANSANDQTETRQAKRADRPVLVSEKGHHGSALPSTFAARPGSRESAPAPPTNVQHKAAR